LIDKEISEKASYAKTVHVCVRLSTRNIWTPYKLSTENKHDL